jgi:TetR/AcrR family transcriptional regulator, repressor for neighboring sulfatase
MGADFDSDPVGDRALPHGLSEAQGDHVLAVATVLFAKHGPATLSLKWVALEADVPSDLIATEWPTIEALLAAVLDRLSTQFEEAGGDVMSADASVGSDVIDSYHRIMARALLDRADIESRVRDVAQIERWVKVLQDRFGLDEYGARLRLSQTFALEWGWRLFGPHLKTACGLDDEPEDGFLVEIRKLEAQILAMPPDDLPPDEH